MSRFKVMVIDNLKKSRIPTCAVLLAAYNGEKWIEEQLESILKQSDVRVSIFVSVDLSSDRTLEIIESAAAVDSRLKPLPFGERFGGAGKNFFRLIKDSDVTSFDMVALADQDDIWFHDKLAVAWSRLCSGEYHAYSSDVIAFWGDGRQSIIKKSYPQKQFDHLFEAAGPGCTYVFSPRCFSRIQQFITNHYDDCREVVMHDWLLYAFCRENNFNWLIDDEPKMFYRQHESNQIGANNNITAYLKRLQSVRQHWYRHQVGAVAALCGGLKHEAVTSLGFRLRNFYQLRRRPRDVIALLLFSIFGIF